jgi:hypothetical protein
MAVAVLVELGLRELGLRITRNPAFIRPAKYHQFASTDSVFAAANIGRGPLVCGGEIWYSEDGYVEGIRVKAGKRQSFPVTAAAEALSVLGHRRLGLDQQPQDLVDDHAGCEDWTESYAVADI